MKPENPAPPFPPQPDRGQRRYRVSEERLRAFAKLTLYERLKWVEECAAFVRLGQQAMARLGGDEAQAIHHAPHEPAAQALP